MEERISKNFNTVEEARLRREKRRKERLESDYRFAMKHPETKRIFWRLISKCGSFHSAFCNENTNGTNYNLGRQSIGLEVLNEILEACPDALERMRNEHMAEVKDDERKDDILKENSGDLI